MIYESKSLYTLEKQFHSHSVSFNNFKGLTMEDVEQIKERIATKRKNIDAKTTLNDISGLTNYINTLRYLTNPTISQELKTFDERILYLILSCDPELELMKTFISSEITPASHIEDEENETKRQELQTRRKQELNEFKNSVRSKIGFYDSRLLRYESLLSRGLFRKNGLVSDVKIPSLKSLLARAELIKNLNIITDISLLRLRSIQKRWIDEAKDPKDLNSLAYNLLNRYKDLHIYNVEEQIIVFMLIADPNLDLLRFFEEESNYKQIKARSLQELGFYNKELINVEQLYHDKFEPNRILSAWTEKRY